MIQADANHRSEQIRTKLSPNQTSVAEVDAGHTRLESTLKVLLDEPEIQLMMQADRVDAHELLAQLEVISTQIKGRPFAAAQSATELGERPAATAVAADYRSGVGIMLLDRRGKVFIARRADMQGEAWQMPQGGIDGDENPRDAALRELREEIGTDNVDVIAESRDWFYYDVPPEVSQRAWGGKWCGQRQKWFVMLFRGQDTDINLATEHPEFDAWRWASAEELAALAAPFKRQLYTNILGEFATVFRD